MNRQDNTEKKLLAAQIEEQLMAYITDKPFQIGEKLPNEFELAEMFQVGRSTIREAVKTLVTKGILEVRRGAGTFVCSTNTAEEDPLGVSRLSDKYKLALELVDIRLLIEPEIAAWAAQYATDEDIRQLIQLCDETEQLYLSGEDHMGKDIEFHTCIARCSKNRVMENLIPIINNAIATFVDLTARKLRTETIETHRAVTESIASHDATGARCAMIMHLTYNRRELVRQWKEHRGNKTSDRLER